MIKTEYATYKQYLSVDVYGGKKLTPFKKLSCRYLNPSTNAVLLIRQMKLWDSLKKTDNAIIRKFAGFISVMKYNRLVKKYGIFVNPEVKIGQGLKLPHPNGIIIGAKEIKVNVTIYQQVTIGSAHIGDYKAEGGPKQPIIEDGVVLFSGSKVIGNIVVSSGSCVGANAVLTKNTESNNTYVGVPASKIVCGGV